MRIKGYRLRENAKYSRPWQRQRRRRCMLAADNVWHWDLLNATQNGKLWKLKSFKWMWKSARIRGMQKMKTPRDGPLRMEASLWLKSRFWSCMLFQETCNEKRHGGYLWGLLCHADPVASTLPRKRTLIRTFLCLPDLHSSSGSGSQKAKKPEDQHESLAHNTSTRRSLWIGCHRTAMD